MLTENLKVFKKRGLYSIHLNINSLLTKIDELRDKKASHVMVLGITGLKLDNSINNYQTFIKGYNIIRCDWNRKGRRVVCYISSRICYNAKNCISNEIENIFIDLLIPKNKTNYCWNNIKTARPIKVSRHIARKLKHTKYIERGIAYTRGSE